MVARGVVLSQMPGQPMGAGANVGGGEAGQEVAQQDTPPIQVTIQFGPQAGREITMQTSPIVFGRDASCHLAFDQQNLSREHGELRFEQQQWILINRSTNGTTVNRKKIKDAAHVLAVDDTIKVGKTALFSVVPSFVVPAGEDAPGQAKTAGLSFKLSPKLAMWAGIGGLWVLVLLAIILAQFNDQLGGSSASDNTNLVELSPEAIRYEIITPVELRVADDREVVQYLRGAKELWEARDTEIDGLYRAYEAFRNAIAFTDDGLLDTPLDQRIYQVAQEQLIAQVAEQYRQAVLLFQQGDYERAERAFNDLREAYPAPRDSQVKRNLEQYIDESRTRRNN